MIEAGVPKPPRSPLEVVILDGVVEAVAILKEHKFVPVVVTNQPDVARGDATVIEIEAVNQRIQSLTTIKDFYVCFHDDFDACECRKPKPGLIFKAAKDLELDLSRSFMIGDRWKDVAAGLKAGLDCFFIDHRYGERAPEQPYTGVSSLLEAVKLIIGD